jgi:hypothetical protein
LYDAGQDDQQIKHGQPGPHFNEALTNEVHLAAVKPLYGPGNDTDDGAEKGEGQAEQD